MLWAFALSAHTPGSPHPASLPPPLLSQLKKARWEVSHDPVAWLGGSLHLIQLLSWGLAGAFIPESVFLCSSIFRLMLQTSLGAQADVSSEDGLNRI